MSNEGHLVRRQARAAELCQRMLAGQLEIIAGARELSNLILGEGVGIDPLDEDVNIFVCIDGETDHLPLGKVRELWDSEALKLKDREAERITSVYKEEALAACGRLLVRIQKTT